MATNRVFVRYSETYDMNTVQNRLSVIGIHTPTNKTLYTLARGLFMNFSKLKIHGCDVAIACASQMPIDPLGVGTEPGQVAPQDLMNPMLFKACTGEGLNTMLDVIYGSTGSQNLSINENRLEPDGEIGWNPLDAYYDLLSDESWRRAIPQMGMVIKDLKPLVHDLATLRPLTWDARTPELMIVNNLTPTTLGVNPGDVTIGMDTGSTPPELEVQTRQGINLQGSLYEVASSFDADGGFAKALKPVQFMSTGSRPLPALDTLSPLRDANTDSYNIVPQIPRVYCGVLVMPPAVLQSLYFRIKITWKLEFMGFRPYSQAVNPILMGSMADDFYKNLITPAGSGDVATASAMSMHNGSLDGIGLDNLEVVNASMR